MSIPPSGTDIEEKGPAARYFNRKHTLPRTQLIKVRRFGHELVRARMKLLRHAIEATAAKGQPVPLYHTFFSESCAPIAPCAATHEYLRRAAAASPPRSFIEDNQTRWTRNDPHIDSDDQKLNTALWRSEFAKVCPGCQGIGLPASDFRFSPGWVTLWHEHAKVLLRDEAKYDAAFMGWGWSKLVNGIPDESYWSTLLQHHRLPSTGTLTTYMEPGDPKTGHSVMFREQDVERLWSKGPPSFFARKFLPTPKIDAALTARLKIALANPGR